MSLSTILHAAKRKEDAHREEMDARVNYFSEIGNRTKWENKTSAAATLRATEAKFEALVAGQQAELNGRRERLRALLAEEEAELRAQMTSSMTESKEARLARLKAKAASLRAAREAEQAAFAAEAKERQWRAACDDLRHLESKEVAKMVRSTLAEQVMERKAAESKVAVAEREYAESVKIAAAKAVEQEAAETAVRKEEARSIIGHLDEQMAEKAKIKAEEEAWKKEQTARMVREWENKNKILEQQAAEKRAIQTELRGELDRFNVARRTQLELEKKREVEEELEVMRRQVEEEKAQIAYENAQKEMEKAEVRRYRDHLKAQLVRDADNEAELEKLRAIEVEKAWAKREAAWAAEADARAKLLAQVQSERDEQIAIAAKIKAEEAAKIAAEEAAVEREIQAANARLEAEKVAKMQAHQEYLGFLDAQIAEREAARAAEKEARRKAMEDFNNAVEKEQAKINEELKKDVKVKTYHPLPHSRW